ncbi:MAG: hypothetical protein K0S46_2507 [Moraxellaceae bacterium]|jgi:hypothetical protein|nr:hypothetical protein [Moraxellaceae bacterium]
MERKLDLTITGGTLRLRSRPATEGDWEWGPGNRAQGAVLHDGLVLLDALADDEFGADVILRTPERFSPDKRAQRTLQLPFTLHDKAELVLGSPSEELPVALDAEPGEYTLIFEVCLGRDVFYTFTLLRQPCAEGSALKPDGWGLKKGQLLQPGVF